MPPALSVVVPVRDGAATLAECLAALRAAAPRAEIVVVDDGSVDGTAAILDSFPDLVRVRHAGPRGPSAARNAGLRLATGERVAFVDADVVVAPDTFTRLGAALDADPSLLAANATYDLEPGAPGLVSAYANTSLRWQLRAHGPRVATAFTSCCLFTRAGLRALGAWDERRSSRYADDVATRWVLPPRSIAGVGDTPVRHLKPVGLAGLCKHRFNVGVHFVEALLENRARARADNLVLAPRYPVNTLLALATIAAGRHAPLVALAFVAWNLPFALYTLRRRGLVEALAVPPLSALEGFAFLLGLLSGAWGALRARAVVSPQA